MHSAPIYQGLYTKESQLTFFKDNWWSDLLCYTTYSSDEPLFIGLHQKFAA